MFSILWFVIGITVLITAAKYFTQAAETIGLRAGLSPFAVGVVIVSVGTSLPELIASIASVRADASEIVPGNILGSSISNLLLVLGLTALVANERIDLGPRYLYIDLNFLAGAAVVTGIIMTDGVIRVGEASIGVVVYIVYVIYLLTAGSNDPDNSDMTEPVQAKSASVAMSVLILVASGIGIYLAANLTIDSLSTIAEQLGVSKAIVSVTLLSFGTTLPECVVSVAAARSGNAAMAVGNVLGSCIFNAMVIPGVSACFGAIQVPGELIGFTLPVYGASVLTFYLLAQDKKISNYEGALYLCLYALVIGKISGLL